MSDAPLQRSPLTEFLARVRRPATDARPGISLGEQPFLGYLNLRTEPAIEIVERIERLSGIRLPREPNTFTETNETRAMWLGPDDWLIVTPSGGERPLTQTLDAAGQGHFFSLTDISHNSTTIRISGPKALEVLSKGCSVDLDPSIFGVGSCAQTLFAKAHIVICFVDRSQAFDLIVRRSFAEYLALWLQDASAEYGLAIS